MRTETKTQDWFLRDHRTRKWIRQCVTCGQFGRDEKSPVVTKVNFEIMFPLMVLNELGQCEQCAPEGSEVPRQEEQ